MNLIQSSQLFINCTMYVGGSWILEYYCTIFFPVFQTWENVDSSISGAPCVSLHVLATFLLSLSLSGSVGALVRGEPRWVLLPRFYYYDLNRLIHRFIQGKN